MLYREIIAVCSEIHTKHINILYGLTAIFVKFKCAAPRRAAPRRTVPTVLNTVHFVQHLNCHPQ